MVEGIHLGRKHWDCFESQLIVAAEKNLSRLRLKIKF